MISDSESTPAASDGGNQTNGSSGDIDTGATNTSNTNDGGDGRHTNNEGKGEGHRGGQVGSRTSNNYPPIIHSTDPITFTGSNEALGAVFGLRMEVFNNKEYF